MSDDVIPIQPSPAATPSGPTQLIKSFSIIDASGRLVEVQGVCLIAPDGIPFDRPMSEETGKDLLAAIVQLHNLLQEYTGCGHQIQDQSIL